MKIAVVGGGITGLTAAYKLAHEGHSVTVYERSDVPGGLGTYLNIGGTDIERYYHHFFQSDKHLISLIDEMGLSEKLKYYRVKTGIYRNKKIYPFSSPIHLLKYGEISLVERIRCGAVMAFLKLLPNGLDSLDRISAEDFIKKWMGASVYENIWGPLLEGKFSEYSRDVPALWLWGRIYDRSLKLGYLDGSASVLFKRLIEEIEHLGGNIYLNAEVDGVESKNGKVSVSVNGKKSTFDKCLMTTVSPTTAFLIKNNMDAKTWKLLDDNDHLGAVCVILELKKSVQSQYWLNICEKKSDVLVMIEHTNLIDKSHYGNNVIVYLANYLHRSSRRFQMKEKDIIEEYANFMKKINPKFQKSWIIKAHVTRVERTQTIFHTGALKTRPPHKLPVPGLYMANIDQMYPHDRNLNLGVMLGKRASEIMMKD